MNTHFAPKVSVIIPVYNGSNFLKHSIECALNQTYENLEVIVVNDGSTDGGETERIALSFGDRIRYFRKENGGVSSALNYGISQMTGEYFSWLSHDDAYTPEKVADSISAIRTVEGADERTIAYSWGNYIDGSGTALKPFPKFLNSGHLYTGDEMIHQMLTNRILNGCCMLIPKIVFDECGGFNEELRYSQDALMWYTIFFKGFSLVFDGKPNVMYRLHGAQTSRNRHDLFEHDALVIAQILAPQLLARSTKDNNLLFLYAYKMARFRCKKVCDLMIHTAKGTVPFTLYQRARVFGSMTYGNVRGSIKRAYYRFILKPKD